jgi:AbiV family abortive infection protein
MLWSGCGSRGRITKLVDASAILGIMVRPIPPRDDLLALLQAAKANAEDLISDAELLADAGRFPRAHALATLAHEEIGKAQLCLLAVMLPEITHEEFWAAFKSHTGKLIRVTGFGRLSSAEPIGPIAAYAKIVKGQSSSAHTRKLRGLYVDYKGGRVLLPRQVNEKEAKSQIRSADEALALTERPFPLDHLDWAIGQISGLIGPLKEAAKDPDGLAAALQESARAQGYFVFTPERSRVQESDMRYLHRTDLVWQVGTRSR